MDFSKQEKIKQLTSLPEVQQKLAELKKNENLTVQEILEFWKNLGVELTEEELQAPKETVSDLELAGVTGGKDNGFQMCGCIFAGLGAEHNKDKVPEDKNKKPQQK